MEAGRIGFCIVIYQLASFRVREASWKSKLFGQNFDKTNVKTLIVRESMRNCS